MNEGNTHLRPTEKGGLMALCGKRYRNGKTLKKKNSFSLLLLISLIMVCVPGGNAIGDRGFCPIQLSSLLCSLGY